MTGYKIKFNKKRCISCMACIVHCKQKNRTPAGLSLNKLSCQLVADDAGKPVIKNKYQPCIHCQKCVEACPTGAMKVRESDELVYIAPTRVNLNLTEERWPDIEFRETREL